MSLWQALRRLADKPCVMAGKRKHGHRQHVKGQFLALPKVVIESPDFSLLSGAAVKLLIQVAAKFNGKNNGDLSATYTDLSSRGWRSKSTLARKLRELEDRGFLLKTRHGFFKNPGARCDLYAVTWLGIDECPGKDLEVPSSPRPPRSFSVEQSVSPSPKAGQSSPSKSGRQRPRDESGRFSSPSKQGRVMDAT